jgi:hypothetical protein
MFCRVVMWRDAAERQLDADHLHVGLPLAVDALPEAEADELVLGRLTRQELLGLVVEVVELALEDRDDVPGHVLADLGVLERTRLGTHAPQSTKSISESSYFPPNGGKGDSPL